MLVPPHRSAAVKRETRVGVGRQAPNLYCCYHETHLIPGPPLSAAPLLTARGSAMGRGRQKAKQTKVARELKYHTSSIDVNALQRELTGGAVYQPPPPPVVNDDDDDDDPIALYSKYVEEVDDEPIGYVSPSRRR